MVLLWPKPMPGWAAKRVSPVAAPKWPSRVAWRSERWPVPATWRRSSYVARGRGPFGLWALRRPARNLGLVTRPDAESHIVPVHGDLDVPRVTAIRVHAFDFASMAAEPLLRMLRTVWFSTWPHGGHQRSGIGEPYPT
jgi:hypothetical protein